ncbi:RES domain-containing protein [Rhizobium leguminosarum]|uniref:RES domain-containing protein n=1 Tax=Rhizobium leguminosarum TaxID=384 RepID=UPI001C98A882|nr:RES domain-containing protein [Rhizobium leguminosarum]MBY5667380.1 RES domain-containing protein [Rhizobium leguminosarum]MBY5710113.1 RES domain-containing protein [Rhizobium leguminosarum]MBY5721566.1 RES domain-containing protein [Rhizobium leguminosarum]
MDLVNWTGDTYRLIPSRFPPVAVYEGLVLPERLDQLAKVEDITNPRLRSLDRIARTTHETPETSARLQNWNLAPFAYGNPEGSTFFNEDRPCLEVADSPQTSLAVSVAKREMFLKRTSEPSTGIDMRMLKTPLSGNFWDLRAIGETSKEERWAMGANLPAEADGIIYRPPERPSGISFAVVNGRALGKAIQAVHYRYVWNGKAIAEIYAFDEIGRIIEANSLKSETDVLAA